MARVVFLFLDGVGIGLSDPDRNPFLRARLSELGRLLGSIPTLDRPAPTTAAAHTIPLDASLGMPGTPQSGTGQTSLLTGLNARGTFRGPLWALDTGRPSDLSSRSEAYSAARSTPGSRSRSRTRTLGAGRRAAGDWLRHPLAARAAGLLVRHEDELARGDAIASEIENTGWRVRLGHASLPSITPAEAGVALARIAAANHLTFFAHYATDTAGHRGGMEGAVKVLERVDAFLGGYLSAAPSDAVLLIASDHGNVEDVTTGHTRNPTLGVVAGPHAERRASGLDSIIDVADAVIRWLGED